MDTLMKADIFFFVTTGAVVVATLIMAVCAFYAIRTMRAVHLLVTRVHRHVDGLEEHAENIKRGVVANVHFVVRAVQSIASIVMRPSKE